MVFLLILYLFLCASTIRTRSWKEHSSLVIVPMYAVARANALSLQLFVGVRFLTAAFTCWYSGWSLQPGETKNVCLTPMDLNNIVDLGPTKSGIAELRQIFSRVCF